LDGLDKIQKALKAKSLFAEGLPLIDSSGKELYFYVCTRKRAVALSEPFLDDAHKQQLRLYEIEGHP
jgi:hypothetical protein